MADKKAEDKAVVSEDEEESEEEIDQIDLDTYLLEAARNDNI